MAVSRSVAMSVAAVAVAVSAISVAVPVSLTFFVSVVTLELVFLVPRGNVCELLVARLVITSFSHFFFVRLPRLS